jgi:Zn-dependent protease with chaperone function
MGHELSHFILSHSQMHTETAKYLQMFGLLLMTVLDPFGLSTPAFDLVAYVGGILFARAFSRRDELEADHLGAEIASHACFDRETMMVAFDNMKGLQANPKVKAGLLDTHPPGA